MPHHVYVGATNGLARLISIGTQLICIPVLALSLTTNEFAAYTIITSLMTWYLLLDVGIGNAVQNRVAESYARGGDRVVGVYVSVMALAALVIFTVIGGGVFLFSDEVGNLLLRGLDIGSKERARNLVFVSGLCFMANSLGVMCHKVLYAIRKGVYANILLMLNSISFLGALYFGVSGVDARFKLEASVLAYAAPAALSGGLLLVFMGRQYGIWDKHEVIRALPDVTGLALKFFSYAVLGAAVVNVDYIILSQTVPADQIVSYSLLSRIFMVALGLYGAFMLSLRPEFSSMMVNNEPAKMRQYVHGYSLAGVAAVGLTSVAMYFMAPLIVGFLMPGHEVHIGLVSIALFSFYIAVRIFTDTYTAALQSLGALTGLLKVIFVQGVISIFLQIFLAKEYGMNGILCGLIAAYLLTMVWVLPRALRAYWKDRSG